MYSKLYARITESSLMEEPINVRYTFVLMLAIADPEGYVIGTNIAIARRLNMDLAEFEECLGVLMSPDANSNSKDHEGRRVLVSDGERGYRLVNYVNYRDMKSPQDRRDYMREYMRKRRGKTNEKTEPVEAFVVADDVSTSKPPLAQLRHADADADAEEKNVADAPAETLGEVDQRETWRLTSEELAQLDGKPKEGSAGSARKRAPKKTNGVFVPPTEAEVAEYCRERGNGTDPGAFVDFYASKGWKVGREGMKDWRASVRNWERRNVPSAADKPHVRDVGHSVEEIMEFRRQMGE